MRVARAAANSFNPIYVTLILHQDLVLQKCIQQVLTRIGVPAVIYTRFSSPGAHVTSPYSMYRDRLRVHTPSIR